MPSAVDHTRLSHFLSLHCLFSASGVFDILALYKLDYYYYYYYTATALYHSVREEQGCEQLAHSSHIGPKQESKS